MKNNGLLDEIRARLEKSTEGWWKVARDVSMPGDKPVRDREVARCSDDDGSAVVIECDRDVFRARAIDDAELIANAKSDLSAMLMLVEAYEETIAKIRELADDEECDCYDMGGKIAPCFACIIGNEAELVIPEKMNDLIGRHGSNHE